MNDVVPVFKRNSLVKAVVGVVATFATVLAFAGSVTYEYDNLGRVTKATYSNGVVITYTYDAAGNRTQHVVTGAAS